MKYLNLAAYKFINLETEFLIPLQKQLKQKALQCQIKGTILLSQEGINLFLAGIPELLNSFIDFLTTIPQFADLQFKSSESDYIPFKRMLVRIRKEIITMNDPAIVPQNFTAPYIEASQLKLWYDDNKSMVLLDTRNSFEVSMGSFQQAIQLNIASFSEFPNAVASLPEALKTQPVITFCTGGIRCEKAATYLMAQGFTNVWQLRGGILAYFENCGGEYFDGNCFVFDDRVALNPQLQEVEPVQEKLPLEESETRAAR